MSYLFYISGFVLCSINDIFIGSVINSLWKLSGEKRPLRFSVQTSILGNIEGFLYFIVFSNSLSNVYIAEKLLFLFGGWLSIKTLSVIWNKKIENKSKNLDWPGERFNVFLIGNLMTIMSSLSTSYILLTVNSTEKILNIWPIIIFPSVLIFIYFRVMKFKK